MNPQSAFALRFVDRTEELQFIERMVDRVRLEGSVFPSLVNFFGLRGIGKTILFDQLRERLTGADVPCALVDLAEDKYYLPEQGLSEVLRDLVADVTASVDLVPREFHQELRRFNSVLEETRDEEGQYKDDDESCFYRAEQSNRVIDAFMGYVDSLLRDGPVVFLFDSADRASGEIVGWDEDERPVTFFDQLESTILSRLLCTNRVVAAVASQSRMRWKRFEVRRRLQEYQLGTFSVDDIREQMPQYEHLAGKIIRLTFGYPMGNAALAEELQAIERQKRRPVDEPIFDEYRTQLLDELVGNLIDEVVMKDVLAKLKRAFRVLAVFRRFEIATLRDILPQFLPEFGELRSADYLSLIGRMVGTTLVEWDPTRRGYTLNAVLRRIMSLHVLLCNKDRYLEINEAATKLYDELIESAEENRGCFILEKLYHLANTLASRPEPEILKTLQAELAGYLEKFYLGNVDGANTLLEQLWRDDELRATMPEEFSILVDDVRCFVDRQAHDSRL
jgi:hypothetical protein